MLPALLPGRRSVNNLAIPGATTESFLQSPRWAEALKESGGLLLIQFGHNDCKVGKHPSASEADGGFRDNLLRMITEARSAGMTPVLVSPMHRIKFDDRG